MTVQEKNYELRIEGLWLLFSLIRSPLVPTLWRGNQCLSRSSGLYDTGRWSVQGLRTHAGAWVRWGRLLIRNS
jgi:hypothetical protein